MSITNPTRSRRRTALAVVLLAGTALGGFAAGHSGWAADAPQAGAAPTNTGTPITPAAPAVVMPDFANLVTNVTPAVVSITSELRPSQAADEEQGQGPGFPGMPFGMMGPNGGQAQRPRAIEARGSGFIIDANGTIVTNNHVVKGARKVSVTLSDGTELPAKVVGTDPRTDLAVLKIDAGHKLDYIQLGDSADVRPGQWVVAVGNPFGLGGTVTAGIVSARGRDIGEGPYDNFIQIDAPINQGNSGGPLFTQDGKVVGVNTAILSPTGGSVGIGFAIPSDTVRTVVAQLEATGHVTRGYLGVEAQAVARGMSAALHLPKTGGALPGQTPGALVATVQSDSPAAKAGLQPGDVIEQVDGKQVQNPRDLALDISAIKPGTDSHLSIVRDGHTQDVTVAVATMPNEQTADRGQNGGDAGSQPEVGLALAPISPQMRDRFDLPTHTHGAIVAEVQAGSPADAAGIRAGDVLVGVNTRAVNSPDDAVEAIRGAAQGGKSMALRIMRNGHAGFVALDLSHHGDDDSQG